MEMLDSLQSNLGVLIGHQIAFIKGSTEVFGKLDNVIIDTQSGVTLVINGVDHTLTSVVRHLDVRDHTLTFMDGTVLRLTVPADAMPKAGFGEASTQVLSPTQMVKPGQQEPHEMGSHHPS